MPPKQRRGKRDTSDKTLNTIIDTTAVEAADAPIPIDTVTATPELRSQFKRAHAIIESNHKATIHIHEQWRLQLSRVAYIVLSLALYQASLPVKTCCDDISDYNSSNAQKPLTLPQQGLIIVQDSLLYLLGAVVGVSHVVFLRDSKVALKMSNPWYRIATALVPVMLLLRYFEQTFQKREDSTSCLATSLLVQLEENVPPSSTATTRSLPVILIFHGVVTVSMWVMTDQSRRQKADLKRVIGLTKDINEALAKKEGKSKT